MAWTAVVNPSAGRRGPRSAARLVQALEAREVAVHVTGGAQDAEVIARRAFELGHGVVACGGDGTVASLAAVAAHSGGTLAIVPTGSGNDFARQLGLDHGRPLRSLDVLRAGRVATVDLARVETANGTSRIFTTVAHVGIDVEANRRANAMRWPAPLARYGAAKYVLAATRAVPGYRLPGLRIRVDAQPTWDGPAWLVAVGNSRAYGGGLLITPDADLHDGQLDVCVVGPVSRLELLARLPRVRRGTHTRLDTVRTIRGGRVEIDMTEPAGPHGLPYELWASGERVGPLPATLEPWPDALHVMIPA